MSQIYVIEGGGGGFTSLGQLSKIFRFFVVSPSRILQQIPSEIFLPFCYFAPELKLFNGYYVTIGRLYICVGKPSQKQQCNAQVCDFIFSV